MAFYFPSEVIGIQGGSEISLEKKWSGVSLTQNNSA
jgi:hypothetical protein